MIEIANNVPVFSDMNVDIRMTVKDTVTNFDSIQQKILYVICTRLGSRPWRPLFGSRIEYYLFEPFDQTTADWIKTYSRVALEAPENGLDMVDEINVVVQLATQRSYLITIEYSVPALAYRDNFQFALRSQA